MGWFDQQIEYRKKREREHLAEAYDNLSRSITGRKVSYAFAEGADVNDAIAQLLKYFGIKQKEIPAKVKNLEDRLDYLLSASGIMYREVILQKGWHQDATGAMITRLREDGSVVAVLPAPLGGYEYTNPRTGKRIRITGTEEKKIGEEAFCFYRPLPQRRISVRDLFQYMAGVLNGWDYISFGMAALMITLVGMLMPKLNHILMNEVVRSGSSQLLAAVMSFMLFASIGSLVLSIVRQMLLSRINIKLNLNVQAAVMMRVLSLPADFFKKYSSGELNQYLTYMNSLCDQLVNTILSTGITGIFSLIYLTQIFAYARSLVIPSLLVTISTVLIGMAASIMQIAVNEESMRLSAKEKGMTYALIEGIQKIRLSGAENRAFIKWTDLYAREAALLYNKPAFISLNTVITTAVSLAGTIVMYYIAVRSGVTVADYYAFNTAYAYIAAAFSSIASVSMTVASIKPSLDIIRPLLEAEPELQENKETVTNISGQIELSHVTFRYSKDGPAILDDLNLTIRARQYVAICGRTGCGKSTLVRLLLGFEKPQKGAIFYDRKDMSKLDLHSLRKLIGTVMQDGFLFNGSIFENISVSAPSMTLEEAWEVAETAGLADDIRAMPMGMHTVLQEGKGGISGGQRQRLMIARALAQKPKILLFDEATSALDNITQKQISDALDRMKCTRIVIAHRLSTIQHCDRILVLEGGKIAEEGTYEELISRGGYFAELVSRQRVD